MRSAKRIVMTPEQWQQAGEVLADAIELKPEDRSAFLDHVCSSAPSFVRNRHVNSLKHLIKRHAPLLLSSLDSIYYRLNIFIFNIVND
jgi:hypothetical protein